MRYFFLLFSAYMLVATVNVTATLGDPAKVNPDRAILTQIR
jgi:hypothetical protein